MFSTNQKYSFSFPTDIRFGLGVRNDIAKELKGRGLLRPLVVTDNGLRDNPLVTSLCAMFKKEGLSYSLFADFSGNPIARHVAEGVQAFKSHSADSVVAIGGGAALDVAKAIALMSCHEGSILDYCDDAPNARAVTHTLPYFVAIPTTSGTGSEVGRSTVISDEDTHEKKVVFHPSMLARLVIIDPELTLTMPAAITAATGMDALSHCLESYLAKDFHPVCDAIALHGLSLIKDSLPACYRIASNKAHDQDDIQARGTMMLAAMMGAIAFQKGLGVTHSCAHALSSVCNTHHGLANGVMLPYAMAFNARRVPHKFAAVAKTLDLPSHDGAAVIDWLNQLREETLIPNKLCQIDVRANHLDDLIRFALKDGCHQNNPVPVTQEDFVSIFKAALV
jgi:alcohol dehydrogenase class IV